jgi:hypothetical protein
MPLNSIHNGRGFFSDYWLGSVLSARKSKLPKLTAAQARKSLWWLSKLHDRVDTVEPPSLTDFRERFARPLLGDLFGYSILEDDGEPRLRLLAKAEEKTDAPRPAITPANPAARFTPLRKSSSTWSSMRSAIWLRGEPPRRF